MFHPELFQGMDHFPRTCSHPLADQVIAQKVQSVTALNY
jgi:hypothetical protein